MRIWDWWCDWRRHLRATAAAHEQQRRAEIASEPLEPRILLAGDIRFIPSTGTLAILGSDLADTAVVQAIDATQLRASLANASGTQVEQFARSAVRRIEFYGYAGNDYFRNYLEIACYAVGHAGNDQLLGGLQTNELYGNDGDDYLAGGPRNDRLYGGNGADRMFGMGGDDELTGQAGDDYLRGLDGNDVLQGEDGADTLVGDNGNDRVLGGPGNDLLRGMAGADELRGNAGNDQLFGDTGDDRLYGDAGSDKLTGGDGSDLLFGGDRSLADQLQGDAGRDRFLSEAGDQVLDRTPADGLARFEPGDAAWTAAEIEVLDRGIQAAFAEVGNYSLLRDSLDSDETIVFRKYTALSGGASSSARLRTTVRNGIATYEREIAFRDWNESDPAANRLFAESMLHELGHSWDSSAEISAVLPTSGFLWTNFLSRSGWRNTAPSNPSLYNRSTDGEWWYLKTATFVRDYGRTNPREDWATVWEYYFDEYQRGVTPPSGLSGKLGDVAALFYRLGQLD